MASKSMMPLVIICYIVALIFLFDIILNTHSGFNDARNNKSVVSKDDVKDGNFGVATSSEFADPSLYVQTVGVVTFEGDIDENTLEYSRASKLRIQQAYTFPRCLQKDDAAYNASCLELSQIIPIIYYTINEDDVKENDLSKASLQDVAYVYNDSYLEELKITHDYQGRLLGHHSRTVKYNKMLTKSVGQERFFDDFFIDFELNIGKNEYIMNILKDILHNHVLLQKDLEAIIIQLDNSDDEKIDADLIVEKIDMFQDFKYLLEQQIEYVAQLLEYHEDEATLLNYWNAKTLKNLHEVVLENNRKIALFEVNDMDLLHQIRYRANQRRYQDGGGGCSIAEKAVLVFAAEFAQCAHLQTLIIVHSSKGFSFHNISEQLISGLKYHSSFDAPSGNCRETAYMDINAETNLLCCDLTSMNNQSKKTQVIKDAKENVRRYVSAVDGEPCMDGYIAAMAYPPEDEGSLLTPFVPPWQYKATMDAAKNKSHPHRAYFDEQMEWLKPHSITIKKVCLAIDVNLCKYNSEYSHLCNDNHSALGINIGIPKAPIPKGWHTKQENGIYTPCTEDEIVFDRSSTTKKFLYENPTTDPIKEAEIKSWGCYAPYTKFMDIVQSNIVEYFNGSINQFNEQKLTSTIAQKWPSNIQYSPYVRKNLISFHTNYGPHLADIERQLCHVMHYKDTITTIQKHQRLQYFSTSGISDKTDIIIQNRWDIKNGIDNDDINKIHQEYGSNYDKDGFYILLKAFIKTIPARIIKQWDTKRKDDALHDESTWVCKVCLVLVEDEKDDNDVDMPHPACEICFDWYHVKCTGIVSETLKDKKNVFLCRKHSGTGKFVTKLKKGFKY